MKVTQKQKDLPHQCWLLDVVWLTHTFTCNCYCYLPETHTRSNQTKLQYEHPYWRSYWQVEGCWERRERRATPLFSVHMGGAKWERGLGHQRELKGCKGGWLRSIYIV